jgi:hypothetical protein
LSRARAIRKPPCGTASAAVRSVSITPADPLNTIFPGPIGRLFALTTKKSKKRSFFIAFALGGAFALPYISLAERFGPITHLQTARQDKYGKDHQESSAEKGRKESRRT